MALRPDRTFLVYPSACSKKNFVYNRNTTDPYNGARVRHDEMLHDTLIKLFQEHCRGRASRIKKFLREFDDEPKAIFKLILKKRPRLGKILSQRDKLSLLWITVLSCYQKSAELLVRSGANVNELCNPPLDAYVDDKTPIINVLLQMFPSEWNERFAALVINAGVDLQNRDDKGQTVLHLAINRGQLELIKLMLEKGVDVNARDNTGATPLLAACSHKKADEMVPLLVRYGADVMARDMPKQENVLHRLAFARDTEHVELARFFIEQSVSLEDREMFEDYQPIHVAALQGKNELLKLFLDHGSNVNALAKNNVTPLYLAAGSVNPVVLLTLLKRGANIDARKTIDYGGIDLVYGSTALHNACNSFFYDGGQNFKILVSAGANISVTDHAGRTPYAMIDRLPADNHNGDYRIRRIRLPIQWNPNVDVMLRMLAIKKSTIQPPNNLLDETRIQKSPSRWAYYQSCLEQIERLKARRLFRSFTLFDLLTKCHCRTAAQMWNVEFKREFEQCDLSPFPNFADDLREVFANAECRHQSMVQQEEMIEEAAYDTLPHPIVRGVVNYYACEDCDIRKIVQASRRDNQGLPRNLFDRMFANN
ncbi:ankyrin-3-like [Nasonia vitripennis]|uniref:Uncharacterized protein n=1 Tax=Nasonia vitripennis TaxID=7425 RepID=A0A7M7HFK2_NASVI|nr:ankyrin-3-like [Nasonia vitripennis]